MKSTIVVGCISILFSGAVPAFENEPEGFRNIKWGADFSKNSSEMISVEKDEDMRGYFRKNEKLNIGGAKLKKIVYVYRKGKFVSVIMETRGVKNKSALYKALHAQFGESEQPNEYMERYFWQGDTTNISLNCESIGDVCHAYFVSLRDVEQEREEQDKAATKAGKDF